MGKSLSRNPNLILLLLAGYFLVNAIARIAVSESLELDEAQQSLVSQWFDTGYDTQPPFYNWVQYGVVSLFGISVPSLALLKNSFLFATYMFYWLTARKILNDSALAIVATLGLLTIPQISFEAQRDLTHTVAVIFSASLFLYGFCRTLKDGDTCGYLITGIAIGIGTISKYNFVLLPASALLATAIDNKMYKRLLDWRLMLTFITAFFIVSPHAVWLLGNFDLASSGTLAKMKSGEDISWLQQVGAGVVSMITATIGFSALTCVLFFTVTRHKTINILRASDEWTRLIERLFLAFVLLILSIIIFGGVSQIKDRWLTPLLIILPLYICLKAQAAGFEGSSYLKRLLPVAIVIMLIIPTVLYGRLLAAGLTGNYSKLNVPYTEVAESISAAMAQEPALIIAGDAHLAGNMRLQFPATQVDSLTYPHFHPSWNQKNNQPAVLIWRDGGRPSPKIPTKLADWIRSNTRLQSSELVVQQFQGRYLYGKPGDIYHFAYTIIYADQSIETKN